MRIIKTKKKLSDALIQLLEERNYDDIKISDLCLKAGVSRATFYNNFNTIDDVMNYYFRLTEEQIKSIFLSRLKQFNFSFRDAYRSLIHTVLSTTCSTEDNHIVSILSRNNASQVYMALQVFNEECVEILVEYYKDQINGVSAGLVGSYLAGASTGIIFYLFQHHEEVQSVDEIENLIFDITAPIFKDVSKRPFFEQSL